MNKSKGNMVTSLLASTIILSQLSGVTANAEEALDESTLEVSVDSTTEDPITSVSDVTTENDNTGIDNEDPVTTDTMIEEVVDTGDLNAFEEETGTQEEYINESESGINYLTFDDLEGFYMDISSPNVRPDSPVKIVIGAQYSTLPSQATIIFGAGDFKYQTVSFKYDSKTDQLEGYFHYSKEDYLMSGQTSFEIHEISIDFENGDHATALSEDFDFIDYTIEADLHFYEDDYEEVINEEEAINEEEIDYEESIDYSELVENLNVSFEENTIKLGETVNITVDFDYSSAEVTDVRLSLLSESNNQFDIDLNYDEDLGMYVGEFHYTTDNMLINKDRTFKVDMLTIEDDNWNMIYLHNNENNLSSETIELVEQEYYYEKPSIDVSSLKLSSNYLDTYGKVQITLDILADVDLKEVNIHYLKDSNEDLYLETVKMKKFQNTDTYHGHFYNMYRDKGTYTIDYIEAIDIYGNSELISSNHESIDLSAGTINTTEIIANVETSIDMESLSVSHEVAKPGDTVEFSVKIDSASPAYAFYMRLYHEDFIIDKTVKFYYDEPTDTFKGQMYIDESTFEGEWLVGQIWVEDDQFKWLDEYYFEETEENNLFTVSEAQKVFDAPEVNLKDVFVSTDKVTLGESVTISVDMDIVSERPLREIMIYGEYYDDTQQLVYNPINGYYETKIEITDQFYNRLVDFSYMSIINDQNNHTHVSFMNEFGKSFGFSTYGMPAKPAYDYYEIHDVHISEDTLNMGDEAYFSLSMSNSDSIKDVAAVFTSPVTYEQIEIDLKYNTDTEKYETQFDIDHLFHNGIWEMTDVRFVEKGSMYYRFLSQYEFEESHLFEQGSFRVEGVLNDFKQPVIDTSTLNISHALVTPNDSVDFSVNVTSNNPIKEVKMVYKLPKSGYTKSVLLSLNNLSGKYEGSMQVSGNTEAGLWTLDRMTAVDSFDNAHAVINDLSLSKGNFIVENSGEKITVLDIVEEEFEAAYDSVTNKMTVHTPVTEPELINSVILEYTDISTFKTYSLTLNKDETPDEPVQMFSMFSMSISSSLSSNSIDESDLFKGELILPEGVKSENLRLVKVTLIGVDERDTTNVRQSSLNDQTNAVDNSFGLISQEEKTETVTPDEEEIVDEESPVEDDNKADDNNAEDITEDNTDDNNGENITEDNNEEKVEEGTSTKGEEETDKTPAEDTSKPEQRKNESEDASLGSKDDNPSNQEKDPAATNLNTDSDSKDAVSTETKNTENDKNDINQVNETESKNATLPQTGSKRSTGIIMSGWLMLAGGASLLFTKVFKKSEE